MRGQSLGIHYNFLTFSLYCCTSDITRNIKSLNYLNYADVPELKENARLSLAKVLIKMHMIGMWYEDFNW